MNNNVNYPYQIKNPMFCTIFSIVELKCASFLYKVKNPDVEGTNINMLWFNSRLFGFEDQPGENIGLRGWLAWETLPGICLN